MISFDGRFIILDSPEHGKLTLKKWKVHPCGADSIEKYFFGEPFPLNFYDLSVVEDPSITSIEVAATCPVLANSAAIVDGGWLPPSIALLNSHALADRNFIAEISSKYEDGRLKRASKVSNFENVENVPFSLDVIPYAVESNIREIPKQEIIEQQIEEVIGKVRKALPRVSITKYYGIARSAYVEKLVGHLGPQIAARQKFFFEFSKQFRSKVAKARVRENWEKIIALALSCSLRKNDLAVLVGLLVVAAEPRSWPGVKIVKPGDAYTMADGYNAACDIMLFELLLNMRRAYPQCNYTAITGDRYLIKLSALLSSVQYAGNDGQDSNYRSSIPLSLFAGDMELAEEFARIVNK